MDLHISNLDPATTHKALKRHFKKLLNDYGINCFDCNKPKGKPYAFVTIPEATAAERFLRDYAQRRTLFMTRPLVIKRGNKMPDPRTVEGLRSRANDAITRLPDSDSDAKVLTVAVSCGVCTYDSRAQLVYRPEWEDRSNGLAVMGRRAMTIATPIYNPQSEKQSTLFKIAYDAVEEIVTDGRSNSPSLTLILNKSPKAYHLPKKSSTGDMQSLLAILTAQLTLAEDAQKPVRVRGATPDHEHIFATCLVYRIELTASDWPTIKAFLHHKKSFVPPTVNYTLKKLDDRPFLSQKDAFLQQLATSDLSFPIRFQLQRLVSNVYLLPATVQALIPAVAGLVAEAGEVTVGQALRQFAREIPFAGPAQGGQQFSIASLTSYLKDSLEEVQANPPAQARLAQRYEHLYSIHRALVTPAGVYLMGPDVEPVNRVLREYSQFANTHFLRVNFRDEDNEPIRFDRNNSLKLIHDVWFKSVLDDGIEIGGQTFTLLGFSNSSLKEQGCWFMAPFTKNGRHFDAWTVVQDLGNFSHLRAPAKCAARIGQAFSDTPGGAVRLGPNTVFQMKDVQRNNYTFSDGCGTISRDLLKKVWATYKRNCRPTLFQVRWGGAKGMISLDDRLEGEVLHIRPSMLKFNSRHNALEICDAARRDLPFFLNRPMVKILEDLGVPDSSFLHLQNKAIVSLRDALSSPQKAAIFLDRKGIGKACNLSWLIDRLGEMGFDARNDFFLQTALEHATLAELRMMKHKARIPVENGYTLFGIMDETGVLEENQIFCRASGKTKTGLAAITRSPALHPGDIQMVAAVEVPLRSPLMALDNCVVFSQHGGRDLPSKLSGGDLDGDLFNVIFDRTLLPKKVAVPAEYRRPEPIDLYRTMEKKDISNWFIEFMKNDQLARIALAHLQLADFHPEGTFHPDCLKLAELHSTAVDFQKTGIPVNLKEMPRYKALKPHFMAPDPRLLRDMDKATGFEEQDYVESEDEEGAEAVMKPDGGRARMIYYHSNRILGQLYDKIDERSFLREIDRVLPTSRGYIAMKQLWGHIERRAQGIQWEHMKDFAREVREEYEELVYDLMHQHGYSSREPLTEIEVFMGSIIGKGGTLPSRTLREDSRTMKDTFEDGVIYITRRIVHGAVDALSNVEFDTVADWYDTTAARDQALERAMACLAVSLEPGKQRAAQNNKDLKSFQYVAGYVALRELTIFEGRNATHFHGLPILNFT